MTTSRYSNSRITNVDDSYHHPLIIRLVQRGRKKGRDSYMPHFEFVMALKSRYVNVYLQYWYLIPHHQLVLNHQLQVACIRGS